MSQKGFLTDTNWTLALKVILNVGTCVSWAEWFVSFSWFNNTTKVTIASMTHFCFSQKRAIKSQTRNMNQKCANKRKHDENLIKMGQRTFLTDLKWALTHFNWSSLCQLRGMLCNPFLVWKYRGSHIWIYEAVLLQSNRAIMSERRSMNQKCSHKLNHDKNLNKM